MVPSGFGSSRTQTIQSVDVSLPDHKVVTLGLCFTYKSGRQEAHFRSLFWQEGEDFAKKNPSKLPVAFL